MDIRCCDCMELLKSLPDKSVDLVVTDPPYALATGSCGGAFGSDNRTYYSELTEMADGISESVLNELVRVQKKVNMYIWGNWTQIVSLIGYVTSHLPNASTRILCWHKTNPIPACCNKYLNDTEYCLHIRGKGVPLAGVYADHKTYWVSPANTKDKKKWGHPTIKPENIIEQLIKNSSKERESAGSLPWFGHYRSMLQKARKGVCRFGDQPRLLQDHTGQAGRNGE